MLFRKTLVHKEVSIAKLINKCLPVPKGLSLKQGTDVTPAAATGKDAMLEWIGTVAVHPTKYGGHDLKSKRMQNNTEVIITFLQGLLSPREE